MAEMKPKKNQHFVPKFYLREWCKPGTDQVFVYDNTTKISWPCNIDKIAAENYFYDFDLKEFFSEETVNALCSSGIAPNGRLQIIENMFSENLEGPFATHFAEIIEKARESTPWIRRECYFVSSEIKEALSVYLAFQFFRTKAIRSFIKESGDRIAQFARRLGAPEEKIEEITLSKERAKRIHNRMLLDKEQIMKSAYLFYRLTWILGVNKTNGLFYTSDNPIALRGHEKTDHLHGVGLSTPGVEIAYPLSPDLILVMVDGEYHKHVQPKDRRYFEISRLENIMYYNSLTTFNAQRFVISMDDSFCDKI